MKPNNAHSHAMPTNIPKPFHTQIFENDAGGEEGGNDVCSSYGTHSSNEGKLGKDVAAHDHAVLGTLQAMNASIANIADSHATMAISHATVIEKLKSLENAVATHQIDMTWVRDDMKAVHNAMEKLSEHVPDTADCNAEEDRLRGLAGDDFTPEEPWGGKGLAEDGSHPEPRSTPGVNKECTPEEQFEKNAYTHMDGSFIAETQNHTQYAERLSTIAGSPEEEGVSDWEAEYAAALGQSTSRDMQTGMRPHVEVAEEESQQLALSCPSAQPRTPAGRAKMWTDFKTVVTKWPAPTAEGHGSPDGWVSAKRGRGSSPEHEEDMMEIGNATCDDDSSTLNLNEPPEKHVENITGRLPGGGPGVGDAGNSKRGGRGARRGAARGRRPPPQQPRYHSTVRGPGRVAL